jgi:hypothetical protein
MNTDTREPQIYAFPLAGDGGGDRCATRAAMERDYLPGSPLPQVEIRIANALEYMAYHMGQNGKKLDRLIAALERIAEKS